MKSNKETIKTYIQQVKTHGNSANVFFEYSRIYSYGYHYILGKFLNNDLLIINDTGYSATTSKHIHLLRDTANEMNIVNYNLTNIDLILVYNQMKEFEYKLHKARKPQIWYNKIKNLYTKWFDFVKIYGIMITSNNREIKESTIAKHSQKAKDIQKIMLRVEQYYTALTLNMSI